MTVVERSDVMSDRSRSMPCVYIIKSRRNNRYYIGSTTDIVVRLMEHNRGKNPSTKNRGPWDIVFSQEFTSLPEARRVERKLKSFKSRRIIDKIVATGTITVNH